MAVTDQTPRVVYNANGSVVVFTITFAYLVDSDIDVYYINTSGVATLLTQGSEYTVNTSTDEVTTVATYLSGEQIVIVRNTALTQTLDLHAGGSFPADDIEAGLDRVVLQSQESREEAQRAVKVPIEETSDLILQGVDERKSQFAAFDAAGEIIASPVGVTGTPASAFGATLIDDADAAAARTTLDVDSTSEADAQLAAEVGFEITVDENVAIGDVIGTWNAEFGKFIVGYVDQETEASVIDYTGDIFGGCKVNDTQFVLLKQNTATVFYSLWTVTAGVISKTENWTILDAPSGGGIFDYAFDCKLVDDNVFVVTWGAVTGESVLMRVGEISSNAVNWLTTEQTVDNTMTDPSTRIVRLDAGRWALVWKDTNTNIYYAVYEWTGSSLTTHISATVFTTTGLEWSFACIEFTDTQFAVLSSEGASTNYIHKVSTFTYTAPTTMTIVELSHKAGTNQQFQYFPKAGTNMRRADGTAHIMMGGLLDSTINQGYTHLLTLSMDEDGRVMFGPQRPFGSFGANEAESYASQMNGEFLLRVVAVSSASGYNFSLQILDTENLKMMGSLALEYNPTVPREEHFLFELTHNYWIVGYGDTTDWNFIDLVKTPTYIGIATEAATSGNPCTVKRSGIVTGLSGLTAGMPVFVDTLTGTLIQEPTDWKIGVAISTTAVAID